MRQELVPLLRRHYQPALTRVILRLMDLLQEESAVLTVLADRWRRSSRRRSFDRLPKALQRELIHAELVRQGIPADAELVEKLRDNPQTLVSVGPGMWVRRSIEGSLILDRPSIPKGIRQHVTIPLRRQGEVVLDSVKLAWRVFRIKGLAQLPRFQPFREFFDADRIGPRLTLRHWQPGDRYQPIGMPQPVRLQDIFVNLKVPRWERQERILIESASGELFWVEGLRIGERFKVTPQTRRCLELTWQKTH
jgi:tRNA(Ile)-lysidine synthase